MWATLYTDASFSPEHGGAWAVWLVSSRGRIVRSGRCPRYVKSSNEAELAAIFAGLWLAVSAWGGGRDDGLAGVTVRSDCKGALGLLDKEHKRPKRRGARRLRGKLLALIDEHGLDVEARWVPGHQRTSSGTAAYLNNRCDKLAKRARKRSSG